jgi:CheY-like chemotaxis protein
VHGFAHSAKGLVEITSEQEEGTTVSIYLPQTLERPAADSGRAPPRFDARKQRVLVVEDDADVMNTAAECLRDCGFEVLTAADGDEGLAILRSARRVDILFSDIAMPGSLNGVQLARAGVVIWPKLKVLLTSGYAGTLLEDRGFDEDWPLLSKPYHRDDLLRLLETLAGTEEGLPPAG